MRDSYDTVAQPVQPRRQPQFKKESACQSLSPTEMAATIESNGVTRGCHCHVTHVTLTAFLAVYGLSIFPVGRYEPVLRACLNYSYVLS